MSFLEKILLRVGERLEETKRAVPPERMRERAEAAEPGPPFRRGLECEGTSLIAEVKRASPSRGLLCEAYDPAELARDYERAGARAVSVLTETEFFGGSPEHLQAVRAACALPVLRKDFVMEPYQCWEARAWGASAALLIVRALGEARLRDLVQLLGELGLDALVEVHTEAEAEQALRAGARLVGVNNRDLATFRTDRAATGRIARVLPPDVLLVSESGIASRAQVLEVEAAGARAVLVGEALVTARSPFEKVRELLGESPGEERG